MNQSRLTQRCFFIVVLLLIALGITPCFVSQNVMAASIYRISLLAETMQPIDSTIEYNNNEAFLTTTADSTINDVTHYIGQLNLPDGATITKVVGFGLDTDANTEFSFALFRYKLIDNPVYSQVTAFAFSGITFRDGKIEIPSAVDTDMALVDNAQFSYAIYLVLPSASDGQLGVLRFLIEFSLPQTNRTVVIPLY